MFSSNTNSNEISKRVAFADILCNLYAVEGMNNSILCCYVSERRLELFKTA